MSKSTRPASPRPVCAGCTSPIEREQWHTFTFRGAQERAWHWACYLSRQLTLPGVVVDADGNFHTTLLAKGGRLVGGVIETPTVTPIGNLHDVVSEIMACDGGAL